MMLFFHDAYKNVVFLLLLILAPICVYSDNCPLSHNQCFVDNCFEENNLENAPRAISCKKDKKMSYFLYISDFISSFIEIPTSNVLVDSSTISSRYLAGRAPIYKNGRKVGTCSASFLCIQNADNILTDISNYLSVDNGLIVSWFTPSTLLNLELDSIVHSMVTECIVKASTKIGFNPFYGKTYNMIVSSDDQKIYFQLTKI